MRRNVLFKAVLFIILVTILLFSSVLVRAAPARNLPVFLDFVAVVTNDQAGVVRGVYIPGLLAAIVIQQPSDNPGYVSEIDGTLTQFAMAAQYGSLGFLAHDFQAGARFSDMLVGEQVWIVFGDGAVTDFVITAVSRYQALQPDSPNSNFVDLISGVTYTATDVFKKYYTGGNHVTFQTCILRDGNSSWGRLFITAFPLSSPAQSEDDLSGAARR